VDLLFQQKTLDIKTLGMELQDARFDLVGFQSELPFEPIVLSTKVRIFTTRISHF
jgi:hypothetical protein